MKCTCDRSALLDGLAAACSVAAARTPKPILQCVRLTASKGLLTLTAYDQEVGIRYRVSQVDVNKTGETLVSGERLLAVVRESSDETMTFETEDDTLHVRGADSHFQMIGQNVREFPPVPDAEGEASFSIKVGALREAMEQTLFAAARENTRYAINGVLWQREAKRLKMVATDGRRLALSEASLEKAVGDDGAAIVPTKAIHQFMRLHADADETVDVHLAENQVILRTEHATLSSVLVEGQFPKYEDVIPRDQDKKVTLDRDALLSAVRRAALLSSVESKGVRLRLSSEGMVLTGRAQEQGEATVQLRELDYAGPEITIGFNPEFLIDALKVCGEQVSMELKEPTKPGVFRSGPSFLYVVMPVNLS